MSRTLSPSALQLLSLVRASLWQRPADYEVFSSGLVDWQEIGRLAMQQTVGVTAFEGAFTLPPTLLPPKDWSRKAIAFLEANRRTHILVDGCVAEAVAGLRGDGVRSILLKGQAYARAYPRPELRQCGDIDLYVGDDMYIRAYSSAVGLGWKCKESFNPGAKHCGCELHGVMIELHRVAAKLSGAAVDRRFQEWSRMQLSTSSSTVNVAAREIPVPTPAFDIVYVFLHLYHHFLHGGIGLRHLCDWTMLLHAHAGEIDRGELRRLLSEFRLLRGWRRFAPIAVNHLGLPASECPFYSEEYGDASRKVLSVILREGNFGRARIMGHRRPEGYIAGKLYSFRHGSLSYMRKIRIDPGGAVRALGGYLHTGLARIMKDMMTGARR